MPTDNYIKREDVLDYLTIIPIDLGYREIDDVENFVKSLPAADVEPVRHGRWIPINRINPAWTQMGIAQHRCSVCGSEENLARLHCPECGAKMDEEDDNEDHA